MSIPKTCKAAVVEEKGGGLVYKDVEVHPPKRGEILIKSLACGVCHSDSIVATGMMNGFPRIPGHEVVGDVVAVGPDETKWKVGDRAGGAWHGGHDGVCKACNRGLFQMCENELVNGVTKDGGYSEYVILRSEAAVSVPTDLDPAAAAPLLCAGVTTFNGVRKLNIPQGDTIAVQGLGGLGHLAIQFIRKMGYRTVALSSSNDKREFAMKLGANDYVDGSKTSAAEALQKIGGAAAIIVTAPNPKIIPDLVNGLHAGGKLLILAPVGDVSVSTFPMITKGLSVHGWPSGHALDSEEAIDFADRQGVECMIEKFPLKDAQKAMDHMMSGKARFRAVLTF